MLGKRTLFDWQDAAPQRPTAPIGTPEWQQQQDDFVAAGWTDHLCKIISEIPVMRGMLEGNHLLTQVPISFVASDPQKRFAYYDIEKREIVLNAEAIKKYAKEGNGYFSELSLHCVFSVLHEFRHAYQYAKLYDPWIVAAREKVNLGVVSVYDSLVREADATAFALTGMYDLVAHPEIHNLGDTSFHAVIDQMPESASRDAFLESVREDPRHFYDGAAQQAAFRAYFSKENAGLLSVYIDGAIQYSLDNSLTSKNGGSFSAAFANAASLNYFGGAYAFMSKMPSLEPPDEELIVRENYLSGWPITPHDFMKTMKPEQVKRLGYDYP